MSIKFNNIEEKEDWIEEHSVYDEANDVEFYICPKCKKRYEDFDEAVECCDCSDTRIPLSDNEFVSDEDDY